MAITGLATFGAMAQEIELGFPRSTLLTNYNRILIGQMEGIEGGAYTARSEGPSANWYNPAGLASAKEIAISASTTGYELNWISLSRFQLSDRQSTVNQLPSFFGIVLAPPALKSERLRLGASLTTQRAWSTSLDVGFDFSSHGSQSMNYSSRVALATLVPGVAMGYVVSDKLNVGLGLNLSITGISENVNMANITRTANNASNRLRSFRIDANIWHIIGTLGFQWKISKRLILGLMLKSPGIRLYGRGLVNYNDLNSNLEQTGFTQLRDEHAAFYFRVPAQVNFGAAYQVDGSAIEVDIFFYGGTHSQPLFRTKETAAILLSRPASFSQSNHPFRTPSYSARPTVNAALGGRKKLSDLVTLHGGAFTDFSPNRDSPDSIFPEVNLFGFTAGISLSNEHLSGSLGFAYTFGRSHHLALDSGSASADTETELRIHTLNALASISYQF